MRSALVVLQPSDRSLRGDVPITSENLTEHLPSADEQALVERWFSDVGFTIRTPGPISFVISGPDEVFDASFGQRVGSFDLERLPAEVRRVVAAVETEEPPDFGPGNP